jgi:hypothetical protein
MGLAGRARSINFHVLAVALALQAITPDAHDLASPTLLKLLDLLAATETSVMSTVSTDADIRGDESVTRDGDSSSSGAGDQGESPDEICLPGEQKSTLIVRSRGGGRNRSSFVSFGSGQIADRVEHRRHASRPVSHLASTDKLIALVRLIC